MKAFLIALPVVLLLILGGCGEKPAGNKTEAVAPAVTAKQLTPEEEFAETKKKAEAGDAEAQGKLGAMYADGKDVPKDMGKALEWLQKAATQESVKAQFVLGEIYSSLDEISLYNPAKAIEWYEKAAEQGYVGAQEKLGFGYWFGFFGKRSPSDYAIALKWSQKAAEQGSSLSQFVLGMLYLDGKGVRKDATKAFEWLHKAAEDGHILSQGIVAEMYAKGEGVPKNAEKAFEWYLKAAASGDADAQNNVGVSYARGEGISRNLVLAYAWYNLAAAHDDILDRKKLGKENRDRIEAQLTPAQRAEGQRLASSWKKGDTLLAASSNAPGSTSPEGKPSKQGTGTAFALSSAGHALTNQHVINGCAEVKIAGREGDVKVITSDSVNDLALLQLPGKTKDVASLNPDPGKLRQGEDIIVFGYPLEWALSSGGNLTPGIISALTGLGNNTNQIQITAPIQPGSSGSPVMDKKGNVVGMVSMKLSDAKMAKATGSIGQNVNFAVNGQTVKAFLDANKVPYKTGGGLFSREKSNADIAEEARKWTVLVECWK